jgi:hypothetical protein
MANMKHVRTATVIGDAEVNRAIGTLVSAFEICTFLDCSARPERVRLKSGCCAAHADPAATMVSAGSG